MSRSDFSVVVIPSVVVRSSIDFVSSLEPIGFGEADAVNTPVVTARCEGLSHSLGHIEALKISSRGLSWDTKLILHAIQYSSVGHSSVGHRAVRGPGPRRILDVLKLVHLVDYLIDIHDIRRDSIEVVMLWVVISSINIIIVLAVPSDILERVLDIRIPGHLMEVSIAFALAILVARLSDLSATLFSSCIIIRVRLPGGGLWGEDLLWHWLVLIVQERLLKESDVLDMVSSEGNS